MTYHKEGSACGKIPYDLASSEVRPCQQAQQQSSRDELQRRIANVRFTEKQAGQKKGEACKI